MRLARERGRARKKWSARARDQKGKSDFTNIRKVMSSTHYVSAWRIVIAQFVELIQGMLFHICVAEG